MSVYSIITTGLFGMMMDSGGKQHIASQTIEVNSQSPGW